MADLGARIGVLSGRRVAGTVLTAVGGYVPSGQVTNDANLRMLHAVCERVGWPPDRMLTSLERHGNTGAASIPLALAHGVTTERLRPGGIVMTIGFGAGLSVAGSVFEWVANPVTAEARARPRSDVAAPQW